MVMANGEQSAVIAFLADPASHGGQPVATLTTHGAMVFLAGDRAFKLKRAVRFPYMDFSTLECRRAACRAELRLNRRTAPALYLGVAAVVQRQDRSIALIDEAAAEAAEVLDWVVVMRRFDQAARFDHLAESGALTPSLIRDLADAIAEFHARAEPWSGPEDHGSAAAMGWVVEDNLEELHRSPRLFAESRLDRLAAASRAALGRHAALIDRRRREGRVRRCHGDLHLRNICLFDGRPTLFDAIEFNDRIAVIDRLYDLAFLLMDLEKRGLRPQANLLFNRWSTRHFEGDGLALLPLYLSARAAVRAKVDASAAAVSDPETAAALAAEAAGYLDLAVALVESPPPRLIAIGGLSGSGKSTLARALAPSLGAAPGAVLLHSDALRKQRFGAAETERLPEAAYREAVTDQVYGVMAERAGQVLAAGHAVIADAVFARPDQRQAIEQVAVRAGVRFSGLWLDAAPATLIDRVARRIGDLSDATPAIVRRQGGFHLGEIAWARLNASADPAAVLARAAEALDAVPVARPPAPPCPPGNHQGPTSNSRGS
ncbi:MAG: AAA family ATPase [Azospirillum sp.]|nr:AAA family ATPase [Azospirillum sp.]